MSACLGYQAQPALQRSLQAMQRCMRLPCCMSSSAEAHLTLVCGCSEAPAHQACHHKVDASARPLLGASFVVCWRCWGLPDNLSCSMLEAHHPALRTLELMVADVVQQLGRTLQWQSASEPAQAALQAVQ